MVSIGLYRIGNRENGSCWGVGGWDLTPMNWETFDDMGGMVVVDEAELEHVLFISN